MAWTAAGSPGAGLSSERPGRHGQEQGPREGQPGGEAESWGSWKGSQGVRLNRGGPRAAGSTGPSPGLRVWRAWTG